MWQMNKICEIIAYKHYFEEFLLEQPEKVQDKIFKIIDAIETFERIPQNYLKHLEGTDGLFEARVQLDSNIWRVFCFFDKGRLVILLNGFQKKTQKVYAFCIMSNYIHVIWQMKGDQKREDVQLSFLKFTAQKIKFDLIENHSNVLSHFEVNLKYRKYQFWLRNSLPIELYSKEVFKQKLDCIHLNPVKAGLCENPEDYKFSSAGFYQKEDKEYYFLSHNLE